MKHVQPKIITSPISGRPVAPKITERIYDGRIYVEAVWIDPASGYFISKGVVKVLDAETRAEIAI